MPTVGTTLAFSQAYSFLVEPTSHGIATSLQTGGTMALQEMSQPIQEGSTANLSFVIVDEAGVAITTLTALTLTYYDKSTEVIINGRNNQNALNVNNVTYGSQALPSGIDCQFIASSRTIRRLDGSWLQTPIKAGMSVSITGSVSNNSTYLVKRIADTDMIVAETVTNESANNVLFSILGKLNWSLQALDTAVIDSRREYEDHIALFQWTWNTGQQRGSQEVQLTVENLLFYPTVP